MGPYLRRQARALRDPISLGAGGMGEVYRARDTQLQRTVAIKILHSHLSENSDARQRLEREARAISSLNHPNNRSQTDRKQRKRSRDHPEPLYSPLSVEVDCEHKGAPLLYPGNANSEIAKQAGQLLKNRHLTH